MSVLLCISRWSDSFVNVFHLLVQEYVCGHREMEEGVEELRLIPSNPAETHCPVSFVTQRAVGCVDDKTRAWEQRVRLN